MTAARTGGPIVVGLGEVLWDVFPDAAHFGGAPANFACHAAALGAQACMVSSVGDDELGRRAFEEFKARDVHTDFLQIDRLHATGTVQVSLDERGQASYRFASDTAWDYLCWNESLVSLASQCDAVCFGTLAQRSLQSRAMIHCFLRSTRQDCLRILDVNLRQNFYDRETLDESLCAATLLKLNDDELPVVAGLLDAPASTTNDTLRWLADRYLLRIIALTRGASSSIIYTHRNFDVQTPPMVDVIDTVGAGDAFTAVFAVGWLNNQPVATIHRVATEVAAFVCTQTGATPKLVSIPGVTRSTH